VEGCSRFVGSFRHPSRRRQQQLLVASSGCVEHDTASRRRRSLRSSFANSSRRDEPCGDRRNDVHVLAARLDEHQYDIELLGVNLVSKRRREQYTAATSP
jgi:hypothetical protein